MQPTFVFFGREDDLGSGLDIPAMKFAVRRTREQILSIGRERSFQRLTSVIGMTSESVRYVT